MNKLNISYKKIYIKYSHSYSIKFNMKSLHRVLHFTTASQPVSSTLIYSGASPADN